jgi:hypothetical protein
VIIDTYPVLVIQKHRTRPRAGARDSTGVARCGMGREQMGTSWGRPLLASRRSKRRGRWEESRSGPNSLTLNQGPRPGAAARHWQMNVVALQADLANFLLTPLQEQH